jgi:hypothetical protein
MTCTAAEDPLLGEAGLVPHDILAKGQHSGRREVMHLLQR